jgi:hypothetical protein
MGAQPPAPRPSSIATTAPATTHGSSRTLSSSSPWDSVAACESGGNWAYSGSSGFEGGLQFLNSTWIANGGGKYAAHAYDATREQQIEIAERVLSASGWDQWPACSAKLGLR